jgi:SAM-dependent MidA family methyltransferase
MLLGIGGVGTDSVTAIQLSLAMNTALAEQIAPLTTAQAQFAPLGPGRGMLYEEHQL